MPGHMFGKRSGSFNRDEGVVLSGYLFKRGNVNTSWKKRYFELLSDHRLVYFKTKVTEKKKQDSTLGCLYLDPANTIVEIFHEKDIQESHDHHALHNLSSSNGNSMISSNSSSSSPTSFSPSSLVKNNSAKCTTEIVASPQIYDIKRIKEEQEYMLNSKMIQCIYRERKKKQNSFRKDRKQSVFSRLSKHIQSPLELLSSMDSSAQEVLGATTIKKFSSGSILQSKIAITSTTTASSTSIYFTFKKVKKYKFSITVGKSTSGERTHKDRKYVFYCESEEERDMWIKAIISSIEKQVKTQIKKPYTFDTARQYSKFLNFIADSPQDHIIHALNSVRHPVQESFLVSWMVLMDCFSFQKSCTQLVKAAIKVELELTKHPETLFRRNSISTKLVQLFFKIHGQAFLKSTLQPLIAKVCVADEYLEIEQSRLLKFLNKELDEIEHPEKPNGEIIHQIIASRQQRSKTRIIDLSKKFLARIIENTIEEGPFEICEILEFTFEESKKHFPESTEIAVGGLFFLRFVCPAIVAPHLQGILSTQPQPNAQRTLTLITKVIQNIANQVYDHNSKEEYMGLLSEFVTTNIEPVKEFIRDISHLDQEAKKFEMNKRVTMRFSDSNDDLELNCYHVIHEFFHTIEESKKFFTSDLKLYNFYKELLETCNETVKSELQVTKKKGMDIPQQQQQNNDTPIVSPSLSSSLPSSLKESINGGGDYKPFSLLGALQDTSRNVNLNSSVTSTSTVTSKASMVDQNSSSNTLNDKRRPGATRIPSQESSSSSSSTTTPLSPENDSTLLRNAFHHSNSSLSPSPGGNPQEIVSRRRRRGVGNSIFTPPTSPHSSDSVGMPTNPFENVMMGESGHHTTENNNKGSNVNQQKESSLSSTSTPTTTTTTTTSSHGKTPFHVNSKITSSTNSSIDLTNDSEEDEILILEQISSKSRFTTNSQFGSERVVVHDVFNSPSDTKSPSSLSEETVDEDIDEDDDEDLENVYHLLEIFSKGNEMEESEFISLVCSFIEESFREISNYINSQIKPTTVTLVKTTSSTTQTLTVDLTTNIQINPQFKKHLELLFKNKFIISIISLFSIRLKKETGVWELIIALSEGTQDERLLEICQNVCDQVEGHPKFFDMDRNQQQYICFCSFMCHLSNAQLLFEGMIFLLNLPNMDELLSDFYNVEDCQEISTFPLIFAKQSLLATLHELSLFKMSLDYDFDSCNISFM
ncbi:hypothetical protein FDP41_003037 [Naegleria fowleri]|uniref:Ras-GAP domain-containing protein n=1 Tax=Naegleria fowleri TaxID=5763 RepID=A0A6A5BWM6_NAEFO|nr:uncharacterized protein FDP41_003037 [Naegleria fowleri]KAF0977715.1 hypothetical protein FDP41_003037 [Naegleria fowleri]